MRKFFFMLMTAWAALSLFVACEKNEEVCPPAGKSAETSIVLPEGLTPKIGYREAFEIARRGIDLLESSSSTRAAGGRALDPANVKYVVTPATRSGSSPDTLMYVFNFADSAGFALVATARESEQLLAVTEKGTYTPGEQTGNPGFDLYMKCAENYLSTLSVGPGGGGIGGPVTEISKLVTYDTPVTVGPFVSVKWAQNDPYNMFCYNKKGDQCPAGCVATAIAQIMSYFSFPTSISLTYSGADISLQSLNWTVINRHVKTGVCGLDCTEHKAIGRLFREIGKQVNMDYTPDESGAYLEDIPACLSHFGYASSSISSYLFGRVYQSLDNEGLVCMAGTRTDEYGKKHGHAWVIDGYKTITHVVEVWVAPSSAGPWRLDDRKTTYSDYVHCNWGWGGDCNGYYGSNAFNTANPSSLDPGSSNSGYNRNYNLMLKTITNIRIR